jgi:predicted nucleic acid-binding protein
MDLLELTSGTFLRVNPHFQFLVIPDDPDDNVFTDCAITAGADFLIPEDHHFQPLASAGYKPKPVGPVEFMDRHPEICRVP